VFPLFYTLPSNTISSNFQNLIAERGEMGQRVCLREEKNRVVAERKGEWGRRWIRRRRPVRRKRYRCGRRLWSPFAVAVCRDPNWQGRVEEAAHHAAVPALRNARFHSPSGPHRRWVPLHQLRRRRRCHLSAMSHGHLHQLPQRWLPRPRSQGETLATHEWRAGTAALNCLGVFKIFLSLCRLYLCFSESLVAKQRKLWN